MEMSRGINVPFQLIDEPLMMEWYDLARAEVTETRLIQSSWRNFLFEEIRKKMGTIRLKFWWSDSLKVQTIVIIWNHETLMRPLVRLCLDVIALTEIDNVW